MKAYPIRILILILIGGSDFSFAASVAGSQKKASAPFLGSDYPNCGQSCLYSKGAENVMLQADYLTAKMTRLSDLKKNYDQLDTQYNTQKKAGAPQAVLDQINVDKGKFKDQIQDSLGKHFCFQQTKFTAKESTLDCAKRYMHMNGLVVFAMRKSIAENQDYAAQLADNRSAIAGKERPQFFIPRKMDDEEKNKKVLLPHIPTYAELMEIEKEMDQDRAKGLRPYLREDYLEWAKYFAEKPKKGDDRDGKQLFVQSALLSDKDQERPQWMIVRNADGSGKFDEKSYNKIMGYYEKLYEKDPKTKKSKIDDYVDQMNADFDGGRVTEIVNKNPEKNKYFLKYSEVNPTDGSERTINDDRQFIYNQAREGDVRAANETLVDSGFKKEMSFQKRAPGSTAGTTGSSSTTAPVADGKSKVHEIRIKDTVKKGNSTNFMSFTISPAFYMDTAPDPDTLELLKNF